MAKYCNEHACCLSVCPRACLRNHIHDIYQFFVHVAYGHGSVFLWQGDEIPRGRDNFGVFFPIDNALYGIAFGTHTKMAEPIEMLFGVMNQVSTRYHVLDEKPDLPSGRGNFGGNRSGPL